MWLAVSLVVAWMLDVSSWLVHVVSRTNMMMRAVVVDCIEDGCNTVCRLDMVDQWTSIGQYQFIRTQNSPLTFSSNKSSNQIWFYSQVQLHRPAQLRSNSKFPISGSRYPSRHPLEPCHRDRFSLFSSFDSRIMVIVHHHLFSKRPFLPCSARVGRLPNMKSLHISLNIAHSSCRPTICNFMSSFTHSPQVFRMGVSHHRWQDIA